MREAVGSIFEYPADAIVIPVNWTTKANGDAVMGAGVAKQAAERWPELPQRLGLTIHFAAGPAPQRFVMTSDGQHIVCFPTKGDWRKPSQPDYIELGTPVLSRLADYWGWQTVTLPRLGCGLGGLSWSDVKPVLERYLDDRFIVLTPAALRCRAGGDAGGA